MKPIATLKKELEASRIGDQEIKTMTAGFRRVRESTDRAIFASLWMPSLGFPGGMATWSMLCLTEPEYVSEYHLTIAEAASENYRRVLPELKPYVDLLLTSADDQGTQASTILPPAAYEELYVPFYRLINQSIHEGAPGIKSFLHSCGAVYPLIDAMIEAGFDVLNPVQWMAGSHSYQDWKDKARGRIALWGGGVNTQHTLPLGTHEEVVREVRAAVNYLKQDSGYVFCAIHNLLANVPPEKIVAIYRAAGEV